MRGRLIAGGVLLLLAAFGSFFFIRNQASAAPCECNIFGVPTGQSDFSDGAPLELGVKFIPNVDGQITGIRFYKQGAMSGTHVGHLWRTNSSEITNATFISEGASGWQSVTFSSPVAVTAGTTYVASVTMNDGRYIATPNFFTTDGVTNGPLTAPSAPSAGGNAVYNVNGGQYPASVSPNSANYWIDVSYFATDAPTVTSVNPTDGATGFELGDTVKATFDQTMNQASFTSSSFTVTDPDNNAVPASYSYDDATRTVSFVANDGFSPNTTYTATLKGGGSGATVKNAGDIPLDSDYTWTFTTGGEGSCPCSLKNRTAPVDVGTYDDSGATELGVKVKASTNGYITSLRFYKPIISTETTHTGNIWNANGSKLASVTFSNESDYGWQEAKLSTPLRVYENQVYVISYGTTESVYVASLGMLTGQNISSGYLTAYADQSSENTATGSTTRNGVFTNAVGSYPGNGSTNGGYYWVDAVFSLDPAPDSPLTVGVTQPKADAYGIPRDQVVTAKLNRALDGATVTNSTFRVFDSTDAQVSGTATYDGAKGVASFTPSSPFAHGQRYTAKLDGSVADNAGTSLGSEHSWSFTVGNSVTTDPHAAPGGPILVITSSSTTSKYYTEILRTEGLNYYDSKDLSQVDAATLANYKVVVLAEMALTQPQADMLSGWVTDGGNLVAMRPDAKLAGLVGLTSAGTTRANQYMFIDTSAGPGKGLVSESIQYKGTADNYTLNGASAIATLYSDANTGSGNPAVTTKSVGTKGGTAVAFTYDLAKSVIAMHQGNQSWAGQNRDSNGAIRANDLFYGAMTGDVQPDWVDLNKFHIPQADEQQRLLANIIIEAARDKQPMPRFWYLPSSHKAALVMAGDDHGLNNNTGTEMILNNFLNNSGTNCSVLDWECERTSHYIYPNAALTNSRAGQYVGYKFEIGDHIESNCSSFASYAALNASYTADLLTWRTKYSSVPNQISHRYHCYVWSDWDSQARVDVAQGIRYDLNYVAFPNTWIGARAPIMTSSAMNMRFTDSTGAIVDVRQAVTNLDDQASTGTNVDALLDNAVGASGYYGIYGTHYDMNNTFDKTLLASARARNVPVISSEMALEWLDGRNSSTFSSFSGDAGQYNFTVAAAEGATGLRAMLPMQDAGGTLDTLKIGSTTVSYQTQTVKGQDYAVFNATPGAYTATYSDYDPTPDDPGGDTGGGDDGGNTGGASSGSSGSSGGSGQGAVPSVSRPRVVQNNAAESNIASDEPTDEEAQTTTPDVVDDQYPVDTPEFTPSTSGDEETDGAGFWPWLLIGLGTGLLLLSIWWFFIWRRRKHDESSQSY